MNQKRFSGALFGALVGDALGVPVEFQSRQSLQNKPVTGMREFGTHRQPAGTWSDDSSLLLCTVDSLVSCRDFCPSDLGERFVRWETSGYWTPHGDVFDVGIATSQAISRLAQGTPAEEAGGEDVYSNGNGSLMRILPIALWFHQSSVNELAECAQRASSLTHRHARSQMACAFYCLMVRALLDGAAAEEAFTAARRAFVELYQSTPFVEERMHFQFLESAGFGRASEREIDSSGYVMHTLTAGLWCLLTSNSFEETVLKAVNLGGDTDTTGCVAGGLAGARYGESCIPADWKMVLARRPEIAALFEEFLAWRPKHSSPVSR